MAFYESSKVRENLTESTSDTTFDTLISDKGTEADNWVVSKLREIYVLSGRIQELPIFSISGGTVNGSTAPQYINDLATNRATYLAFIVLKQFEAVKEYKETIKEQIEAIKADLAVVEETNVPVAVV